MYLIDSLALPLVFCGKISIHEHLPWYDILHWPFVMLIAIHDTPSRRCRHEFYYSYLTALYAYHETSLASRVVAYSIFTTAIRKNASVFPRCIISTIKNPELYRFDKLFWFFFLKDMTDYQASLCCEIEARLKAKCDSLADAFAMEGIGES